jgi:2,3-bisphosphoglycerate-independent phosphoglycerate mutase
MVGHTGNLAATRRAVETVDACLGRVADAVATAGGAMLITSDHGNAEQMHDPETGQPHTAHTMNKVPLILVGAPERAGALSDGRLADVAPTILEIMGLAKPDAMTGRSLLRARAARPARAAAG